MAARRSAGVPGVYAILGSDSFLAERALATVLLQEFGEAGECNLESLYGDETTWIRVLDVARASSLFASRRAVVVRKAEGLKGSDDGLATYLDDPNPGVVLIFVAGKVDRRRSAWKRLSTRATVRPADPLKGRALRGHVMEEIARRGLRLTPDGQQELLERVGQDLRRLMGEMDKLESFSADGGTLSGKDVAAVLGRGIAQPLYKVSDAFWARRSGQVIALVGEILEEGEAPLRVLGTLHRSLRQVRAARALLDEGAPREQFASRTGVLPFKVADLAQAARAWSEPELAHAFVVLGQADRNMKRGADGRVALLAAVVAACAASRAGASSRSGR